MHLSDCESTVMLIERACAKRMVRIRIVVVFIKYWNDMCQLITQYQKNIFANISQHKGISILFNLPPMEIQKPKPTKILNLSPTPTNPEAEQQYFLKHWQVIENAVATYLLKEISGPALVHLKRSLQALLMRMKYADIHENLIKLFYRIYKELLSQFSHQSNCLLTLLAYYTSKKQNYRILFDLLNNYLSIWSAGDPLTMQEKAHKIMCKEIINSNLSEKISNQVLTIAHRYRTTKDHNQIIELEYQLKLIAFLGIYSYCDLDFLERSKEYFVYSCQEMSKNQQIFNTISDAIKRQISLNKILKPSEDTMKYLKKELIEEFFPFMIQYVDYLIEQNKFDKLKMLWQNCIKFGEADKQLLQTRLTEIVKDVKKHLKPQIGNPHQILNFIHKFNHIIQTCFDNNKAITNILTNTIEEVLTDNEKVYHQLLSKRIFKPSGEYTKQVISKLFKLLPNKQRFIKQFQIRFFRWILNNQEANIESQEQFVHMIKKQCGNALCKKLDRMIFDIWRDGQMHYYYHRNRTFRCRLISANDWPKFNYSNINLPESLTQIIADFQRDFRKEPENNHKELTWINEFGTLQIAINGVVSLFSEYEAAIIVILSKSFRPINKKQLMEILQGNQNVVSSSIDALHNSNILQFNEMNETYELNDINQKPYRVVRQQKQNMQEIKTLSKRDDTIIIEASIVRIMKKKKSLPKTQISKFIHDQIVTFKPTLEQINVALERLVSRDFIEIDKMRGMIRYKE